MKDTLDTVVHPEEEENWTDTQEDEQEQEEQQQKEEEHAPPAESSAPQKEQLPPMGFVPRLKGRKIKRQLTWRETDCEIRGEAMASSKTEATRPPYTSFRKDPSFLGFAAWLVDQQPTGCSADVSPNRSVTRDLFQLDERGKPLAKSKDGQDGLFDGFYLDKKDEEKARLEAAKPKYKNKYQARLAKLPKVNGHPDIMNGVYYPTPKLAFAEVKKEPRDQKWTRPLAASGPRRSQPATRTKKKQARVPRHTNKYSSSEFGSRGCGPFTVTYVRKNAKSRLPNAPAWSTASARLPMYRAKPYNGSTVSSERIWMPLSATAMDHSASSGHG